jgi:hypothetical protein
MKLDLIKLVGVGWHSIASWLYWRVHCGLKFEGSKYVNRQDRGTVFLQNNHFDKNRNDPWTRSVRGLKVCISSQISWPAVGALVSERASELAIFVVSISVILGSIAKMKVQKYLECILPSHTLGGSWEARGSNSLWRQSCYSLPRHSWLGDRANQMTRINPEDGLNTPFGSVTRVP